jgi:lipoprotein-anchoring transpeptidase ErfK/SrfK
MWTPFRQRLLAVAAVLACAATAGTAAGCQPGSGAVAPPAAPTRAAGPLAVALTPADGARGLPASTEIGLKITGGRARDVTLTRAGSRATVPGGLRADGTSWVPAVPLGYGSTYTATVTATTPAGDRTATSTTTFTTMPRPSRITGTGLYLFSERQYGVAMPVVVEFDPPVPPSAQAAVQKRLFVQTNPPQPGVWSWPPGGRQVFYRGRDYWRPGTVLTVRAALGGAPTGEGRYGDQDRSASVRIASKVVLDVDNRTKQMTVYANDKVLRRIPVSLGKPSTPSSSGRLVVMSKEYSTVFDTTREGPGGYRVTVNYAMRLTWGGEFIHAAPWSVGDQGRRNVSHGCVNMSWGNAEWLFGVAHVGDPVIVRGTEVHVTNGNGWTAWDLPWEEYVKGSALPVR